MLWDNKPYHSLDSFMKAHFNKKVIKLSLDAGATCPNRDGTIAYSGCIFCGDRGAGEFAGDTNGNTDLLNQLKRQRELTATKWPDALYMAYFQNYTNTYCTVDHLKSLCEGVLEAARQLEIPLVGIALATRPDCLPDDMLDYLSDLSERTLLWIELGLQTANDETARFLRRGYPLSIFVDATSRLNARGIRHVCHLILGLPGETLDDLRRSIDIIIRSGAFGVKLHPLFIQKDTDLAGIYLSGDFELLTFDELLEWLIFSLEHLPPEMTIHRLTGDASWKLHIAPDYALDKRKVLNALLKEMKARKTWQGRLFENRHPHLNY